MQHTQKLTTTLALLRKHGACKDRYAHLVSALGEGFGDDQTINLLTILDSNGTENCLWALRATAEDCEKTARLMAADFAEAVLPIFEKEYPEDTRPREAIQAARDFAEGKISTENLASARASAWDAAWDTALAAARASAWDAARASAWDAAWASARDSARAAARDSARAAARYEQATIIWKYLEA
jgi:hypothetical protein